jgi:hypothetical protein
MTLWKSEAVAAQPTVDDVALLQPADPIPDDVLSTLDADEGLARRLADQKLRDALAAEGFTGRRYRRFEEELAAYGISVLRGWLYTGYILQLASKRGFHLKPTEFELAELARDSDAREELANMTVADRRADRRTLALLRRGSTQHHLCRSTATSSWVTRSSHRFKARRAASSTTARSGSSPANARTSTMLVKNVMEVNSTSSPSGRRSSRAPQKPGTCRRCSATSVS